MLTDPYAIAFLRGGENEAARVAAVSLTSANVPTSFRKSS